MTLTAQTLHAVLDTFQRLEGIWRSSAPLSYQEIYSALETARVGFAEWDADRGLYFLDFSTGPENLVTMNITMLDFQGSQGQDHFRFEWAEDGRLAGVELQTHAPRPLPCFVELSPWLFPEQTETASNPLSLDEWQAYLAGLKPQSPPL